MGMILCKKHGTQFFHDACEHIDKEYRSGIYQEHPIFNLAEMYGVLVCESCWEKHNIDNFRRISEMTNDEFFDLEDEEANRLESEWSKIYDSLNRQIWCVECVAEIQIKQARRKGEANLFSVFERTLNSNHQNEINELEKALNDKFKFQKSSFFNSFPHLNPQTMSIASGGFRYPLTITIYYIEKESEQNEIIQYVKNFLQRIERNQVKIQFLEAENVKITENQFGLYSYERGEENLLREVYLNC